MTARYRRRSTFTRSARSAGVVLGSLLLVVQVWGQPGADSIAVGPKLGDRGLSGRISPLHCIDLFDHQGTRILADDQVSLPFSSQQTCIPCHDYNRIAGGLHFNSGHSQSDAGRPGQPFIYADSSLGLQLPLSYRAWPGAWMPGSIGLSRWDFLQRFGGLLPGGLGEDLADAGADYEPRWFTSGEPEVNCLACHNRAFGQDPAEYHQQMQNGNFAWAATAAAGLAAVTGSIANLPPFYDPFLGGPVDEPDQNPPKVDYHTGVFDERSKVNLDISRRIPNERCYACHGSLVEDPATGGFEPLAEDVHMNAGLLCVDCHTNGLDHHMQRGAEGDGKGVPQSSCRGCHLGRADGSQRNFYGAVKPEHPGLPAAHLERLSCTACHSGSYPGSHSLRVKTVRAHFLSTHAADPAAGALPVIIAPVFMPGSNGQIAPHYLVWPAFWALMDSAVVTPLDLESITRLRARLAELDSSVGMRAWPSDSTQVEQALQALADDSVTGAAVYISGGALNRLRRGRMERIDHPASAPYRWPLAHPVRPARAALGAGGCNDCHAFDAPFFNTIVAATTPGYSESEYIMSDFIGSNRGYLTLLNWIILLRPAYKILLILVSIAGFGIALLAALKALDRYLGRFASGPGDS